MSRSNVWLFCRPWAHRKIGEALLNKRTLGTLVNVFQDLANGINGMVEKMSMFGFTSILSDH